MQDLVNYAVKNGIILQEIGDCQFCGCQALRGVFECHENTYRIAELLDFNDSVNYQTRFLSVDAMALQHSEIHGPWNNHIHLARLYLIFEKGILWDYSKTPLLSNVINQYKRNRKEFLMPPPLKERGKLTTEDLLQVTTAIECVDLVRNWAFEVYKAFEIHHAVVANISTNFLAKL